MDIELFFGRFHPLVVHLPIGFILLAALMEGLKIFFKGKFDKLNTSINIALLATFFGAVASIVIGFLLASNGGYEEETLNLHKWMGIAVAVTSLLAWLVKINLIKLGEKAGTAIIFATVIGVSITGHLGGNLTHGSDYLTAYAPEFVKKAVGADTDNNSSKTVIPSSPDSIVVFEHLINPVLEAKCYACHNPTKSNGGLLLSSLEGIQKGGDTGAAFTAGKSHESLLFIRSTLPQNNPKFMPPKGTPLTYSELKVLQWWIDEGASFDISITEMKATKEIKDLLYRDFDVDLSPKSYAEKVAIDPLEKEAMESLTNSGWKVRGLSQDINLLDISGIRQNITDQMLASLKAAQNHVTRLDLSDMDITDDMLSALESMPNLTYLKLSENEITDDGLKHLAELEHLEMLNLYATNIDNGSLKYLENLKMLNKLYVANTSVNAKGVEEIQQKLPKVKVVY